MTFYNSQTTVIYFWHSSHVFLFELKFIICLKSYFRGFWGGYAWIHLQHTIWWALANPYTCMIQTINAQVISITLESLQRFW